ncbi:MAG: EAL domain-containing protein [Candidatus Accumulibacter sp.]|uniref:EAL and HDOD domain-containing protein n=1 Tax=Accumulibacter sp. TaxID=2053492 RepID=UPI0028795F3B|nr:EAL domain-containing protein [Accumulibacter sp.]MDS4015258.1 EAL domain-containing protein [Accumulibacter sp.]
MSDADDPGSSELFLGRQPILDRSQQLLAYELLFRSGRRNVADVSDQVQATATVVTNAFSELAVGDALGPYRGFINVDREFLFSDMIELLPRDAVMLELLETIQPDAEVVARARELRNKGFQLALDDIVGLDASYDELLELVDVVKVDLQPLTDEQVRAIVARVKPTGAKLLAEKVDSREQMEFCRDLGFELFQGYYFAKPTIIAGKKLDHSQLALMRLTTLLLEDADTAELEKVFKQEPGLTVNLLRLTNSVASGVRTRITSLRHAITVLGRRQLQRWLQLLLFANQQTGAASPLLQLAATRGRLMELLADKLRGRAPELPEQAFMTGIMSLMPTLLSQRIEDILVQLPVAPAMAQALGDAREGQLGALLALAEASESGDCERIEALLPTLYGLNQTTLNNALSQALAWANNIGRDAGN